MKLEIISQIDRKLLFKIDGKYLYGPSMTMKRLNGFGYEFKNGNMPGTDEKIHRIELNMHEDDVFSHHNIATPITATIITDRNNYKLNNVSKRTRKQGATLVGGQKLEPDFELYLRFTNEYTTYVDPLDSITKQYFAVVFNGSDIISLRSVFDTDEDNARDALDVNCKPAEGHVLFFCAQPDNELRGQVFEHGYSIDGSMLL